ncbi:MAG: NAD-dependent epimerase/dehydratase family protein [Fimbriimonas sp.]
MGRVVFITGGAGFIGTRSAEAFANAGWKVLSLDLTPSPAEARHPAVQSIQGSVLDRDLVRDIAKDVDLTLHLAGMVGMKRVVSDPDETYRISVEGAMAIQESVPPKSPVIWVSSSSVYGLRTSQPVRETDGDDLATTREYDGGFQGYACGKLSMEAVARDSIARGRPGLIVRPFNVVGVGQSGSYGMVIPSFVAAALRDEPLTVYGDGSQRRCFSDVETFVGILAGLAGRVEDWPAVDHCLNVGANTPTTIGEVARIVIDTTGSRSEIRYQPYDSVYPGRMDVQERIPITERLGSLGFAPRWKPLRQIVEDVVECEKQGVLVK